MAIYAPTTTTGNGFHKQVASLVKANEGNAASELSSISIDGTSYKVKSSGIDSLAGRDGTIPYLGRLESNKDGYVFEEILRRDVFICENEEDYNQSKNSTVTMKQVFQSWIKGGYQGGVWYGYDTDYDKHITTYIEGNKTGTIAMWFEWNKRDGKKPTSFDDFINATEDDIKGWRFPTSAINLKDENPDMGHLSAHLLGYQFWFYADKLSAVIQGCNTQDTSFYLSPFKMKQYDITVKCKSYYNSDDDQIGIIIATGLNKNTYKPNFLAFARSPNNSGGTPMLGHASFTINGTIPAISTIGSKYNVNELSAKFLDSREAYQKRFTTVSSEWHTHTPKMKSDGNWEMNTVCTLYKNNPTPYEIKYANESKLKKVKPPTTYTEYLSYNHNNWETINDLIDINNLLAPENWWWMNEKQWNDYGKPHTKTYSWGTAAGHSYLRIRRDNNMISAWATKFTGTPPNNDTLLASDTGGPTACPTDWNQAVKDRKAYILTADFNSSDKLNNIPINNWSIASESDGGQIGFITCSQAGATWDIIEMNIPKIFVKTWTNELIEYNPLTKEYKAITDKLPADYCGRGRLCKNIITGKTFYVGDTHFERVAMIEE